MKIGMIFPGYGSQYVGMAKDVYDESRIMQEYFEQASHCVDINYIKLCFASSDVELAKMHHAYTSLFLVSSSFYAVLADAGIKPDVVAGYNVGQFAAMYAAKGITFADGLYLLMKSALYARQLLEKESLAMARIKGCSTEEIQLLIEQVGQKTVTIAVYEMPNQHIISGPEDAVIACMRSAKEISGVKVQEISSDFGVHSAFMQPAVDQFKIYLEKVDFKDIDIPVISNISTQPVQSGISLKHEVLHQLVKPSHWIGSLGQLHDCDLILSIGPSAKFIDMVQQLYANKKIMSVQKMSDIEAVKQLIADQQQNESLVVDQEVNEESLGI